jgi:hypothetical protein
LAFIVQRRKQDKLSGYQSQAPQQSCRANFPSERPTRSLLPKPAGKLYPTTVSLLLVLERPGMNSKQSHGWFTLRSASHSTSNHQRKAKLTGNPKRTLTARSKRSHLLPFTFCLDYDAL